MKLRDKGVACDEGCVGRRGAGAGQWFQVQLLINSRAQQSSNEGLCLPRNYRNRPRHLLLLPAVVSLHHLTEIISTQDTSQVRLARCACEEHHQMAACSICLSILKLLGFNLHSSLQGFDARTLWRGQDNA